MQHQSTRLTARTITACALSVFVGALVSMSGFARALAPTDGAGAAPTGPAPAGLAGARTGQLIGLLRQGDGRYHLRKPLMRALPGVTPSQNGAGIADACRNLVAADPATFAALASDTLTLRRLYPVTLRGNAAGGPGLLWSVEFEQRVGGRMLEDCLLQFQVEDRESQPWCRVRMLLGRFVPQPGSLPVPQLGEDDCRAAAAAELGVALSALRITSEQHTAAWQNQQCVPRMHVRAGFDGEDLAVNEVTGAVERISMRHHDETVTVLGSVEMNNHEDPAVADTPLPNIEVVHDGGGGPVYTDENGVANTPDGSTSDIALVGKHIHVVNLGGADATRQVVGTGEANFDGATEFTLAEQCAYFHGDAIWTWLSTRIDTAVNDSYFDTHTLEVQVNDASHGNAYFIDQGGTLNGGTEPYIILFSADPTPPPYNTCSSDVVYHEYGHYLDWCMGSLFEQGGLSEGWGDILCAYYTDDSQLAENILGNGPLRDCDNTLQWTGTQRRPHADGTCFAGFAWRIREGLIALLGAVAGAARAEEIMFAALEANTTSVPDTILYVQIYDLMTGGDTDTQQIIIDAATAQGLGAFVSTSFRITDITCDEGYVVQGSATTAQISVTVQNTSLSSFQIDVELTGTDVAIASQSTATLDPGESETLDFDWDLSAAPADTYTVTATATVTSLPAEDDTDTVTLAVAGTDDDSIFFDDFESGLSQWTTTGTWGTDTDNVVSGSNCLSDSPGTSYDWDTDTTCTTDAFSLVDYDGTTISLWVTTDLEPSIDYGSVEMSDGGEWMTMEIFNGIESGTYHAVIDASAWDGHDNVQLRVRLWTDYQNVLDGWFIDDIRVYATPAPGSAEPTTSSLASDGFESGNFSGGSGWIGASWTTTGSTAVVTTGPANGSNHARLLGNNSAASRGSITRFANISGQDGVHVQVLIWTGGSVPLWYQDTAEISLSDNNGGNWTDWVTITNGHNSAQYNYPLFDVAIDDLGLSATSQFGIRIRANNCNETSDTIFIDDVLIYATNHPPVFDPIDDQDATVGEELTFTVVATDANAGDTVTLSMTVGAGTATFTPGTGEFAWTPDEADADQDFVVTFEADDGVNTPSSMDVNIHVSAAGGGGGKKKKSSGGCHAGTPSAGWSALWLLALLVLALAGYRRASS